MLGNGNIFLAEGGKLTFTDKIAAVGQVVMDQLENGHATSSGYGGTTYVPSAASACPTAPAAGPAANCANLPAGSWTGGFPPTGAANPAWTGISKSTFNGFIENGLTGATKLQLPFVQSSKVGAIDIIRKPTAGDTPLLLNSRLYKEAAIRILLADTEGDLYPGETRTDSATQDLQIGTPFTEHPEPQCLHDRRRAAPALPPETCTYATALKGAATNNWTTAAPTGCNAALASGRCLGRSPRLPPPTSAWAPGCEWNI